MNCNLRLTFVVIIILSRNIFSQDISGNLEGRVSDTTGIPLAGVNISLQSKSLQGMRGTITNDDGYFRILSLPVGDYNIRVSIVGYREVVIQDVPVRLGKTNNLGEIKLETQTINLPEVTISGEKQFLDPASTSYGGNLSSNDFENLPVDRNYRSMVSLLPQANTSYFGDEVNVGGATGFENKYFVDGVEVTDPFIGASGTNLPYNFIKEIELKAGGYNADSRSSLGGLVNVVTHTGTNEFHGSVFGFYSSNQLSQNKKQGSLDVSSGDFSNYDIGFGIGGPIVLDKLWFYAAYNPNFNKRDVEVPGFGTSVDETFIHSFAAKLNWQASESLHFVFTTTGDPTERNSVGSSSIIAFPPSAIENPDLYYQDITEGGTNISLSGTYTINKNLFLEGLIARVNRSDKAEPSTERGSEVLFIDLIPNIWSGGVGHRWNRSRHSTMGKIAGTLILADHTLNTGIEYKTSGIDTDFELHNILYNSATVTYTESITKGTGEIQNRIPSFFIKDEWKIFRNFILTAGIRWDGHFIIGSDGEVAQEVTVPLQPRFGFVYLIDNENEQRIFGSLGRFSQELGLFLSARYHTAGGYAYKINFNHDPRVNNAGGDTVLNNPYTIRPEVDGLRGQFYDEFSLGYEILVGCNTRLSVQGLYRSLGEAIDDVKMSGQKFQYGNPGRGILSEWPEATRDYAALIISIERRLDERFNFLASYVLSRDYGNYEGLFDVFYHSTVPNQNIMFNDLDFSRINSSGLVPNDRTHVFKFSGYYNFSFGLVTGISFTAQTGTPLSEIALEGVGTDLRMKFLSPRGSAGRTPIIWDLNARIMYDMDFLSSLKPRLILDVFHIASQRQSVDIDQRQYLGFDSNGNPIQPNPRYGQIYRYQPSMSLRLGLEVSF
jgi:hypothetical protein